MERPPEEEVERSLHGPRRREVRHRRHRHELRNRIVNTFGWGLVILGACIFIYYFFGWLTDSTYVIDRIVK